MQLLRGFQVSINFPENFSQLLENFTQFLRKFHFHLVSKKISRNFQENFTQFLKEFHSKEFVAIFRRILRIFYASFT